MLALIAARRRRRAARLAVGRRRRRAVRRRLAAPRRPGSCCSCSSGCRPGSPHPAAAWPRTGARARCPAPAGCYGALALLAARSPAPAAGARAGPGLLAALAGRGRAARGGRAAASCGACTARRGGASPAAGSSSAATAAGCCYAEARHALVAFGPPQSGKSAGLAIPALLEWDGPVVASSIKTDLLGATRRRRRAARAGVRVRPVRALGRPAHTWSPLTRRRHLGRRARGRLAAGRRRRARPPLDRGRRLLGRRRRTAPRAAAVRRRARRRRDRGRGALGLRAGRPRARRGAGADHRRGDRRAASSPTPTRPTTPCGRSRPRPTAPGPRSRPPRRRCCARTASAAWRARRTAARSPPTGCSTSARRCT